MDEPAGAVVGRERPEALHHHSGVAGEIALQPANRPGTTSTTALSTSLIASRVSVPRRRPARRAVSVPNRRAPSPSCTPRSRQVWDGRPTPCAPRHRVLRGAVHAHDVVRRVEGLRGQVEDLLDRGDLVGAERTAVRLLGVGELRRRVADVRAQHDQRRVPVLGDAFAERPLEGVEVVGDLADLEDMPAVRGEAQRDVVGVREALVGPSIVMWLSS